MSNLFTMEKVTEEMKKYVTITVGEKGTEKYKEYNGRLYVDFKTFFGWKEEGRGVKKGEKCVYIGKSFKKIEEKQKDGTTKEKSGLMRKPYFLFHYDQTELLTPKPKT